MAGPRRSAGAGAWPRRRARGDPPEGDNDVEVPAGAVRLAGQLAVPDQAGGIVVFAHGSGSSRHSPRNRYVAAVLNQAPASVIVHYVCDVANAEIFNCASYYNGKALVYVTATGTW